jgi:hypothetical protein
MPRLLPRQDTFYVGTLKGIGRVYQQTFVDTYAKVGFAQLLRPKDAADRRRSHQRPGDPVLRGARHSPAAGAHRPGDRILRNPRPPRIRVSIGLRNLHTETHPKSPALMKRTQRKPSEAAGAGRVESLSRWRWRLVRMISSRGLSGARSGDLPPSRILDDRGDG